jgi:heparin binding hemagglutinin HbhA
VTQSKPKTNRIPAPLYAAAGAGDLAYRQLRRLPAVVTDLRSRAAAPGKRSMKWTDHEIERLRETAVRGAAALMTRTQSAQRRAVTTYAELVARGERVVGTGVVQAADTVNADMEATEAPAEVTATSAATADATTGGTEVPAAKPAKAKRPRPASAAQ